jgi:hypothetical protein
LVVVFAVLAAAFAASVPLKEQKDDLQTANSFGFGYGGYGLGGYGGYGGYGLGYGGQNLT